jgi:cell division protein FtsQ
MKKSKRGYLLLLLMLISVTGIAFAGADVFSIEKITILGNSEFVYNDILRLSGLSTGLNILKLDKELAKNRIEREPYIEVNSISIRFPDEVIITVSEREAIAFTEYLASYIVFDAEGIVLEVRDLGEVYDYIEVSGLNIQGFVFGEELLVDEEYRLDALRRVLAQVKAKGLEKDIREISVADANDIRIISDGGLSIRLGQAVEVDKKLRWMKTEQFEQIETQNIPGELDLSVHTQAVFVPMKNGGER